MAIEPTETESWIIFTTTKSATQLFYQEIVTQTGYLT
jgi:hypothetical protein